MAIRRAIFMAGAAAAFRMSAFYLDLPVTRFPAAQKLFVIALFGTAAFISLNLRRRITKHRPPNFP
jgi:hypothetical protein